MTLKTGVTVPTVSNKKNKLSLKKVSFKKAYLIRISKAIGEKSRIRIRPLKMSQTRNTAQKAKCLL
jgi:hypothetical protein